MSNLSAFFGGVPSPVASIQRGVTAVGSSGATATINAVDVAKSYIQATCSQGETSLYTPNYRAYGYSVLANATLTNTTTVTLTPGQSRGGSTVAWEVIEYV
jgi:hypothetical protein